MRSKLRWIAPAGVLVIAVGVAGFYFWPSEPKAAPAAAQHVPRVAAGSVTAKGTVAPVASRTLSFAISGTVSEVKVKAGDLVTAGQLLAHLDSTDAQAAVTDAEESLSSAQDALDEAEAAATATCAPSSSGSTKPSDDPTPKPTSGSTTCGSSGSSRQGGGDAIFSAQQQVNNAQAALAKAKRDLATPPAAT
jgi:multidrug efflux pump subunit AcrA (membrane-fusion protein)